MAILDLNTYKSYKNIKSTDKDTKQTLIIDAVNAFIEEYCGRVFTTYYNTDKTEYFNANDSEIFPNEYPIVSITSLEYSTDAGQTYATALTEYTDYVIDNDSQAIISLLGSFATVTYGTNSLKLVYKGGYEKPPKDLILAAVHLADYYESEEYIPRKSLAGASTDTIIQPDMTARLPSHIRRVLENYRTIVM
jgi:hypothetical protein